MIKVFDYYFLVLLRHFDNWYGKDKLSYYIPGIITLALSANLFAIGILFNCRIVEQSIYWITLVIIGVIFYIWLCLKYNKKRRTWIREQYKDESSESRKRGETKIIIYIILTIVFFIWTFSLIIKFYKG